MSAPTLQSLSRCFQGLIPAAIATCAADGTPNVTFISQVHYVDPTHVALSYQFFNKTKRNIEENPKAAVWLIHPETFETWDLELAFDHSETSGPIFDAMSMQIEAIASLVGMKGIFKLRAADIFRVVSVAKASGERIPLAQIPRADR